MATSLPTVTGAQQSIIKKQKPDAGADRHSLSQSSSDQVQISHQPQEIDASSGFQQDENHKKPGFLQCLFSCYKGQGTSDSEAGQSGTINTDLSHPLKSSQKLMTSILKKRTRKALNQIRKGGIDLEKPGAGGFTPLQLAVQQGNKKVTKALLQAGVNAQVRGPLGKAPIHAALTNHDTEIVKLLLASGKVNVDQTCNMGQTPLHLSLSSNSTECTQLLLQAGCDYNKKDAFKRSAVYEAAQHIKPAHLELLLNANADPNIPDSFGRAPLDVAAQSSPRDRLDSAKILTVKLLLQHGARTGYEENPFFGQQDPNRKTVSGLVKILKFVRQQEQPDTELIDLLLAHPDVAEQEKAEIAAVQDDDSFSSSTWR